MYLHRSTLVVQAAVVMVALKEEEFIPHQVPTKEEMMSHRVPTQETKKLSATTTTTTRTGRSVSTTQVRYLIIKFESHLMFQHPALKWFGATGRRDIVRTGPGAKRA